MTFFESLPCCDGQCDRSHSRLHCRCSLAPPFALPGSEIQSIYDPGSLGAGNFGARAGFAEAEGAPGPGIELFLGLGRLDVSVGMSGMAVTVFGETNSFAYVNLAT